MGDSRALAQSLFPKFPFKGPITPEYEPFLTVAALRELLRFRQTKP